ncbi:DEAD/DEAH box helicase [Nonomuraea sp. NPDC050786]|uniref:DEAD/DEAH box helicase n=1 Tax=Nonomuraea sp. NPDC050786 TaxID=3154840 RepID=UPI003406E366
MSETPYPPGARILVRDAEWIVRTCAPLTYTQGFKVTAIGSSEFVRDEDGVFFTDIEDIELMRPEDTILEQDRTDHFAAGRLFLEAVLRRTPLPQTEKGLALSDRFLLDSLPYQLRPAELALRGLRPRILLADVVGLGKTLEIGLILAELIRRGRGERILVVTPQQVLEQFQHELWTRFSIPLVRLDSIGVERIQREIPAGRNPFTYYKRVIVSVDTLKNEGKYGQHLEKLHWDAVVIDESHNLMGETTARNRLARLLSRRTDALLLASATPHNGDSKSFAELIRMLDPAAIANDERYSAEDIEHLYIRRTKVSPEVRDRMGSRWPERGPSIPVRCAASPTEERIFDEFREVWLAGDQREGGSVVDQKHRLFPYTLLKSFLSSHVALAATVVNRVRSIDAEDKKAAKEKAALRVKRDQNPLVELGKLVNEPSVARGRERDALLSLGRLVLEMTDDDSAKLTALTRQLTDIGVAPGSATRVVVFSESVPTLEWLKRVLPERLGLAEPGAIEIMHGGFSDTHQQEIVERFSLSDSKVRVLLTGDVASEGVNLHKQCHHLIHYDVPWSLIRIEQRNGRIDRYRQKHNPQFKALILTSRLEDPREAKDDRLVAEKLLAKEESAHHSLGTAEAVTGEYRAEREERRLIQDLLAGKTVEESIEAHPAGDFLAGLLAGVGDEPANPDPLLATTPKLFDSTEEFVKESIKELKLLGDLEDDGEMLAFTPPKDLIHRLSALPASYLRTHDIKERMKVTFNRGLAERKLDEARNSKTMWPDIAYLSDLHPLVDWLTDKVLVQLGRQKAPVMMADVTEPTFLIQGIYSNKLGQPTVVEWMAVTGSAVQDADMVEVLRRAGVGPRMINPDRPVDLAPLQELVKPAVDIARVHLEKRRAHYDAEVVRPLELYRERLTDWEQLTLDGARTKAQADRARRTADEQRRLLDSMQTTGEPLLRILAVLIPGGGHQ